MRYKVNAERRIDLPSGGDGDTRGTCLPFVSKKHLESNCANSNQAKFSRLTSNMDVRK